MIEPLSIEILQKLRSSGYTILIEKGELEYHCPVYTPAVGDVKDILDHKDEIPVKSSDIIEISKMLQTMDEEQLRGKAVVIDETTF